MAKRMILMLLGVVVFIGAIAAVKTRQIQTAIKQGSAYKPPPESVTTVVAKQEPWAATVAAIGTVAAVRGVTVSADLAGIVAAIDFESGKAVRKGDVLVELDMRQERAQLAAAQAERELTRLQLERMRGLSAEGVTARADLDTAVAAQKQAEAKVGEIEATIERKTIRAPFSGILGIRQVDLGQHLVEGAPVVPLQAVDPIYVNFSVPQQQLANLRTGAPVEVSAPGAGIVSRSGKVTAIDSVVDPNTRNVQVQATLANADGKLRPGMFVQTTLSIGATEPVIALPASAIAYAPYGDSVFVVENMKDPKGETYRGVRQQFVKLGGGRGDQIAIVSGLKAGEEVVSSGTFKLRNGAAVQVNNKVQPGNNPAPNPENS
ncbi:MAG TPA: efflux RND transporter periplasmic adaptor subunit [Thermoanaerobaculia bacterium]|nr:efflux RND transporter periplasmic adaptor subunit [Thermoanaerobaculia bacterium]